MDAILTKAGSHSQQRRMGVLVQSKIGLTLIEVMIVVLLISVAVIGAMGFRFYCVVDAKKADVQAGAARIGSMLLETWKGMGGLTDSTFITKFETAVTSYSSQFVVTSGTTGPSHPSGFTSLPSKYRVEDKANNVYYYVALSYQPATSTMPEVLNATISWNQNYGTTGTSAHTIGMTAYTN